MLNLAFGRSFKRGQKIAKTPLRMDIAVATNVSEKQGWGRDSYSEAARAERWREPSFWWCCWATEGMNLKVDPPLGFLLHEITTSFRVNEIDTELKWSILWKPIKLQTSNHQDVGRISVDSNQQGTFFWKWSSTCEYWHISKKGNTFCQALSPPHSYNHLRWGERIHLLKD